MSDSVCGRHENTSTEGLIRRDWDEGENKDGRAERDTDGLNKEDRTAGLRLQVETDCEWCEKEHDRGERQRERERYQGR